MKIALAQLNYHIGNFEGNFAKMQDAIFKAKLEQADLICFSELASCGYPPRDFLEFRDFIRQSMDLINKPVSYTHLDVYKRQHLLYCVQSCQFNLDNLV